MTTMQQTPVIVLPRNNTSLRPLAEDSDKLLLPIGDRPIIYTTLQRLASQGFQEVYIPLNEENEFLRAYLQALRLPGLKINVRTVDTDQDELSVLLHFRSALNGRRFLVLTSDVLLQGEIYDFFRIHEQLARRVTVGIRQLPFDNRLSDALFTADLVARANINPYNYDWHHYACGVFLIEYDVLSEFAKEQDESTLAAYLFSRMEEKGFLHLQDVEHLCSELRSLDDYLHANFDWVRKKISLKNRSYIESGGKELPLRVGEVFIDPDAVVSPKAILIGPTIIGRECHIEERVVVQRSVLRRNVHVERGAILRDCLVNREVTIGRNRQHVGQLILDDGILFNMMHFKQASRVLKNYPNYLGQKPPVVPSTNHENLNLIA